VHEGPRRRSSFAVGLALLGLGLLAAGAWRGGGVRGPGSDLAATAPVVVAARALDAGTVLDASDLAAARVAWSGAVAGLARDASELLGRRLAVAVPAGLPLSASLLASVAPSVPGHRLVRLALDAATLPPGLLPGANVDVLAAVGDAGGNGRVVTVATAELVDPGGGSSPVATLDVDSAGAARLLWAETFAKSVRLLVRASSGDSAPPDVGGVGP